VSTSERKIQELALIIVYGIIPHIITRVFRDHQMSFLFACAKLASTQLDAI
jgi:hypothetical protein